MEAGRRILLQMNREFRIRFGEDIVPFLVRLDPGDLKIWVRIGLYLSHMCRDYVPSFRASTLDLILRIYWSYVDRIPDSIVIRRSVAKLSMRDSKLWTISRIRTSLPVTQEDLEHRAGKFNETDAMIERSGDVKIVPQTEDLNGGVNIFFDGDFAATAKSLLLGRVQSRGNEFLWNWDTGIPKVTHLDYQGLARWLPESIGGSKKVTITEENYLLFLLFIGTIFGLDNVTTDDTNGLCIGIYDIERAVARDGRSHSPTISSLLL